MGEALIRRVIAAFPLAKDLVPELRLIVVAGPRIDPGSLEQQDGLEIKGYVTGAIPVSGGLRSRHCSRRSDHHDGTDRLQATLHLRAAA